MVSGMLTAIRDFVAGLVQGRRGRGAATLKVGDLSVWIEQGPHALLAVVVRGAAPPSLRTALQQAHRSGARAIFADLESFDGDAARSSTTRVRCCRTCLQREFRGRDAAGVISAAGLVIARGRAAGALARVGCSSRSARRSRWNGYVIARRAEPGVVVVSTGRAAGKYVVTGPARSAGRRSGLAAAGPQAWTRLGGEPLGAVSGAAPVDRDRPCRDLLAPPAGVSLEIRDGVLLASGEAPVDGLRRPSQVCAVRPRRREVRGQAGLERGAARRWPALEGAMPMFVKGSTAFTGPGARRSATMIAGSRQLDVLGRAARRQFTVASSWRKPTPTAPAESNLPLSRVAPNGSWRRWRRRAWRT